MAEFDPSKYETKLSPDKEKGFGKWLDQQHAAGNIGSGDYRFYKQKGYGYDYDFRAAYAKNLKADPATGHWSDEGKKPNHPTFSTFSKYAKTPGAKPGTWSGDQYVPFGSKPPAQQQIDRAIKNKALRNGQ